MDQESEDYFDEDELSEVFSVKDVLNAQVNRNENLTFVPKRKLISYRGVFNNSKRFDGVDPIICQTPIFQQVSEEICVIEALGLNVRSMLHKKHILWISKLLHKLILDGDWEKAAKVFLPITQLAKIMPTLLWRIGMEILQRNDKGQQYLAKFFEAMLRLNPAFSTEIIITGLSDLLKNNKEDGIHKCQQLLVETSSYKFIKQDQLYNYYCGVIYYCLWRIELIKQLKLHCHVIETDSATFDILEKRSIFKELEIHSSQMDYFSSKAMKSFEDLPLTVGILDIFITKYVELLLFAHEDTKALDLVKSYANTNRNNPNSHRYLIWLLREFNDKGDLYVTTLHHLSKIDPTGEPAIELMENLYKRGQMNDLINLLFDRLDDSSCRSMSVNWAWLCFLIDNAITKQISHLYNERKEWWLKFHFNTKQSIDEDGKALPFDEDLLVMKRYFITNIEQNDDLPKSIHHFLDFVNDKINSESLFDSMEALPSCTAQYLPKKVIEDVNGQPPKKARMENSLASNNDVTS